MDIQFNYGYRADEMADLELEALAAFVLAREEQPDNTEVSVSFVTDEEIAKLNGTYRGIDGPTDVLSFECDGADEDFGSELFVDEDDDAIELPAFELGDIVIAPDVAERQMAQFGTTLLEELSLLLTHGLLHLCGYDHMADDEAEVMEARERELLSAWFGREFVR